jgi:hypothetical protein
LPAGWSLPEDARVAAEDSPPVYEEAGGADENVRLLGSYRPNPAFPEVASLNFDLAVEHRFPPACLE